MFIVCAKRGEFLEEGGSFCSEGRFGDEESVELSSKMSVCLRFEGEGGAGGSEAKRREALGIKNTRGILWHTFLEIQIQTR